MDRRTLLRRAALVGAVGLAGCSSDDGGPATTTGTGGADEATTEGTSEETTDATGDATTASTTEGVGETTEAPTGTTSEPTEEAGETATPERAATPTESEPQESVTVTVGADGAARYSPDSFTLVRGGEVTWEYAMGGHNVIPESTPDGGSFEGSPGGDAETQDAGFSFSESFDAAGEYSYYCSIHRSIGMEGSFTVE